MGLNRLFIICPENMFTKCNRTPNSKWSSCVSSTVLSFRDNGPKPQVRQQKCVQRRDLWPPAAPRNKVSPHPPQKQRTRTQPGFEHQSPETYGTEAPPHKWPSSKVLNYNVPRQDFPTHQLPPIPFKTHPEPRIGQLPVLYNKSHFRSLQLDVIVIGQLHIDG